MRFLSLAAVGVAALVSLTAVASSGSANAGPRFAAWTRPQLRHPNGVPTPSSCATSNPTHSFVAIKKADSVAGGEYSTVVGGALNEACDEYDAIGSGIYNSIGSNGSAMYSFIGGGDGNMVTGAYAAIGAGYKNDAAGGESFVGAGENNVASGKGSTVGSGESNTASGAYSFVGDGAYNTASGNGSFIGAGNYFQFLQKTGVGSSVSGIDSFIGAGDQNTVAADEAFVGGGNANTIAAAGEYAVIAGGNNNYVGGPYAAIGGGSGNKAEGAFSTIPGGADNEALGAASFAAGYHAEAAHNGSFVWSDDVSGSSLVSDTGANQFVVRASGGTYVYSSENLTSGAELAAGSGTWSSLSDRNAKFDIVPLNDAAILARVVQLPVDSWRYKTEAGVRHIGPMAQDFYASFGVGEDDRHITSIDEAGVVLASLKAIHSKTDLLQADLASLRATDRQKDTDRERLRSRVAGLERKLAALGVGPVR